MNQEPDNINPSLSSKPNLFEDPDMPPRLVTRTVPYKFSLIRKPSNPDVVPSSDVIVNCWPYGVVKETNQVYSLRDALFTPGFQSLLSASTLVLGSIIAVLLKCSLQVGLMSGMITLLVIFASLEVFFSREKIKSLTGLRLTRLKCDPAGIHFYSVQPYVSAKNADYPAASINWSKLSGIILKKTIDDQTETAELSFVGGEESFEIALSNIQTRENWLSIVQACNKWAPHVYLDPAILDSLTAKDIDISFTELWLETLAAPDNKVRCLELKSQQSLKAGRYTVQRELGSGGQGTAYLCSDGERQGHLVVLKEYLLPVFVSRQVREEAIKAFETEARLLNSLSHPGIVALLDFFIEDQRAYLVLEYASGKTLKDISVERGRLDETQVCAIGIKLCEILDYLHNQHPPIVHRDFAPDNLILDEYGHVKLIDFMVAQRDDGKTALKIAGKREYIAPEQFRGKATCQSDIYALGGILFLLLTGHSPSVLATSDVRAFRPDVTPELAQVVSKATAISCSDRYQSAEDLRLSLEEVGAAKRSASHN